MKHLSGPQLLAKAHYRVNYGYAAIDSILEEEDDFEDHEVTTSTQPCITDESTKSDVDPLLVLSQQTQTTREKRNIFTKSFSYLLLKSLFQDDTSPAAKFDILIDDEVVEYLVNMTKPYAY